MSCSSRTEHCRPATSILCGFQATEFALVKHTHTHRYKNTHVINNTVIRLVQAKCCLPHKGKRALIPVHPFHQMSVLFGKEHTPSPGSLKTHNETCALQFQQTQQKLHKAKAGQHTWIVFHRRTHIYVHPELVFLTDISDAVQWVKRALHRGP